MLHTGWNVKEVISPERFSLFSIDKGSVSLGDIEYVLLVWSADDGAGSAWTDGQFAHPADAI